MSPAVRRLLPCLVLLAAAWPLRSADAGLPFPHLASELDPDPAVRWGRLANGLGYAVMHHEEPPGKVSIRLLVLAGSLQEREDERGIAHYLEHMAFNGTTHYPPGALIEQLQALGLAFGSHTNAHTGMDETVYKLDLPDSRAETIETGLVVMADWAFGMLLEPDEVERERGIILAEMRDREGPARRTARALYRAIYRGTVRGERLPIGVGRPSRRSPRTICARSTSAGTVPTAWC